MPPAAPRPQPSNRRRRILLADADAFYVAVARMVDPEGADAEVVHIALTGGDGERRIVEVWPSGQVQGQLIAGVSR